MQEMKDESSVPFSRGPDTDTEKGSFLRGKGLLILGLIAVVIILIIILIIILVTKSGGDDEEFEEDEESSNIYIVAKYDITKTEDKVKLYTTFTPPPFYHDYTKLLSSVHVNGKRTELESDGTFKFEKTGTYTIRFYFKEDLTYLDAFFMNCGELSEVDFSNIDTSQVTTISSLFKGNHNLKSINYGSNFKTEKVRFMHELFTSCSSLSEIDLRKFNT